LYVLVKNAVVVACLDTTVGAAFAFGGAGIDHTVPRAAVRRLGAITMLHTVNTVPQVDITLLPERRAHHIRSTNVFAAKASADLIVATILVCHTADAAPHIGVANEPDPAIQRVTAG
jgi:hypothetical protein